MCYRCDDPRGGRCDDGPISKSALLRRQESKRYRRDLSRAVFQATGDRSLSSQVINASLSSLEQITEAAGLNPDAVSTEVEMPTGGAKNHRVPEKDTELTEKIAAMTAAGELTVPVELSSDAAAETSEADASPEEVVSLISDPEWQAEAVRRRQVWRDKQAHREEVDAASAAVVGASSDVMCATNPVPQRDADGRGYPVVSGNRTLGAADLDFEGNVVWDPDATAGTLEDPADRVAVAESLLAAVAEGEGVPANCSGKLGTRTQNAIKALEPDGAEIMQRYRDGELSPEQARDLAARLRAVGEAVAPEEGKKWTKKLEGQRDKLLDAATEMEGRADAATYAPVEVASLYTDPGNLDSLYDFDEAAMGEGKVTLTPYQAKMTAASLLLSASNDASDARQDAALDAYLARCHYDEEEDRMAHKLVEMIPSGNANSDYKHLGLGEARVLAVTEEGSADWLNLRNTGVGGSEILSAMGLNDSVGKDGEPSEMNDNSAAYWLAETTGKKATVYTEDDADRSDTGAAARGHAWEPALRAQYGVDNPDVEVSCGKQTWKGHDGEDSYQTVNVDGIIRNKATGKPEGLLECKNSDVPEKWENGVPLGYRAQVLSYLDATGLEYADLVARVDGEVTTYRINRNDPVAPEGTKTFADYKPRVEANWEKIKSGKDVIQSGDPNPYTPNARKPIGDGYRDVNNAAANLEGLGIGDDEANRALIYSTVSAAKKAATAAGDKAADDARESGADESGVEAARVKAAAGVDTSVDTVVRSLVADNFDRIKMGRAVGVDGETATIVPMEEGFSDPRGFSPLYSDWIESGFVYQDADGTKSDKVSIMHGADPRIIENNGTGAEHVHGISPEMIADAPRLKTREARKQVHKSLMDGDVIVAHNVNFEQKHLHANIPAMKQTGRWLDTAWLSRHFMDSEVDGKQRNGKLETFSEDNGVEYRNAHRAAEDADMMIDAMDAFFARDQWWKRPKFVADRTVE